MNMKQKDTWKWLRGTWISTTPVLPGVWARMDGGHVVRGRATDPATGKQREVYKVLPEADAPTALKRLTDEQKRIRDGVACASS